MEHIDHLIDRWIAGDQGAAEEIYNLYKTRLYRLAYGVLGDEGDAEETTQDALTYALLNIRNFDSRRSKFTTWMHMITISRCRDTLRKRRVPSIALSDLIQKLRVKRSQDLPPEQASVEKELKATIWEAVCELSPIYREAIVLRHWGGHTYREIGEILGCSLRTAQSRVRLGYKQLIGTIPENEGRELLKEDL
jgi:RNA polymerase sigma-70 factor (ECF subfamily)